MPIGRVVGAFTRTLPSSGFLIPARVLSKVLLPLPELPTNAKNSPAPMAKFNFLTNQRFSTRRPKSSTSINGDSGESFKGFGD